MITVDNFICRLKGWQITLYIVLLFTVALPCGAKAAVAKAPRATGMSAMALPADAGDSIVPFRHTDVKPAFPGGREARLSFLKSRLEGDTAVAALPSPSTVRVRMVIEKDGSLSDVSIVDGATQAVDSAVLAMIAAMPRWKPGYKDGKAVRTGYMMRITLPFGNVGTRVNPEFSGGEEAFHKYVEANLHYPEQDKGESRSGVVIASFVVDEDGSVTDIRIRRHGTEEMDSEVVRLLEDMPRWTPGTLDGKPVRVRMTQKFTFNADGTSAAGYNHKNKRGDRRDRPARGQRMVYILDGREVSKYAIDRLDTKSIERFEYIRPRQARHRFGARAADGAIVVTTSASEE